MKSQNILEYLKNIADNIILPDQNYNLRVAINDGGENSYVGINISTEEFRRKRPVTSRVELHRHTNSVENLPNAWSFQLGSVCNVYADNPDITLFFGSYGKTADEASAEAQPYLSELLKLIKKAVAQQKEEVEAKNQAERDELLARLKELEATP